MWVYILGGAIGSLIIICVISILCRLNSAKRQEAMEIDARKKGQIVQSWGIRTTNIDVKAYEDEKLTKEKDHQNKSSSHFEGNTHDSNSQYISA